MPESLSELFNGGIVTVRHPALLKSGELQRADDCVYREKDPAIWRAPGRQKLNATALGSVWASASAVKGLAHLSFEKTRNDQLLAYSGTVLARCALTASSAPTIDAIDLAVSTDTLSSSTTITSHVAGGFANVQQDWIVFGSNILAGTRVQSVTDSSHVVLSQAPTSNATVTLTFNPMQEIGGPGAIAGTVATNVFTATTGFPFLRDIVGARVFTVGTTNVRVTAVSGQSGTTGHFNIVTCSAGLSNGAITLLFAQGCVQTFDDNGTTDDILDLAQYGGLYFVWTGRDTMQRIEWKAVPPASDGSVTYDDILTTRPVGLNPVVDAPTVAATANVNYAWPPTLAPGYYWFLVTEIYDPDNTADGKDGPNEVESAYYGKVKNSKNTAEPVAANLPALTGNGFTITFPTQVNVGNDGRISTHWGLYMYGPTGDDKVFPSLAAFRRIMKVRITAATGQTQVVQENRFVQTGYGAALASPASPSGFGGFANAARMADGGGTAPGNWATNSYADCSSGKNHDSGAYTPAANFITNFAFNTGSPWNTRTIFGIRVTIRAAADPSGNAGRKAGFLVAIKSGSKQSDQIFADVGSKDMHNKPFGGEMDTWGVAWTTSDLADGTFQVLIIKSGSAGGQRLRVDGVKVEVFFTSSSINLNGKPFRVVTYRDQVGDTVNEPAYGLVPQCTTGDLYQGSLVINDNTDETAIRYSLPGEPEAFPKPYVMRFNTTKRKDRVTLVRALNQVLLVGMENGIKRVNYLPTESDTDYHEGLAHDDLASDHGIPGPLAAVKFDWPGRGTMMAYASYAGVFVTDGIKTEPLNMDLDWPNTVKLSALASCVFRVYAKEKWLVLYYCPAGATHTKNTKALVFSYAGDKIKEGGTLPCTGPITVSGRSSVEVMLGGTSYLFTGHETTGFIYQEDYGTAQASSYQVHDSSGSLANAPIVPIIRTRRIYPSGITHDTHLYKAYVLFSSYGSQYTAVANSTLNSTTLSAATAVFATWLAGMRAKGSTLDEGTIVLSVAGDFKSVVLSRAANADGTGVTFTADDGTLAVSDRGNSIGETAAIMHTVWGSTLKGDLITMILDDTRQGLELQIEKVPLTFTTDSDGYRYDTATWSDLGVNMRLHQYVIVYSDQGVEQTRSTT